MKNMQVLKKELIEKGYFTQGERSQGAQAKTVA